MCRTRERPALTLPRSALIACPPARPPACLPQLRDSLSLYNRLSKRCFDDCVSSFRTRTLDRGEETCVVRCAEKFLKHMARVTVRFGEVQQQQMGAAGAGGAAK